MRPDLYPSCEITLNDLRVSINLHNTRVTIKAMRTDASSGIRVCDFFWFTNGVYYEATLPETVIRQKMWVEHGE